MSISNPHFALPILLDVIPRLTRNPLNHLTAEVQRAQRIFPFCFECASGFLVRPADTRDFAGQVSLDFTKLQNF
jgi:hypothetical protein